MAPEANPLQTRVEEQDKNNIVDLGGTQSKSLVIDNLRPPSSNKLDEECGNGSDLGPNKLVIEGHQVSKIFHFKPNWSVLSLP